MLERRDNGPDLPMKGRSRQIRIVCLGIQRLTFTYYCLQRVDTVTISKVVTPLRPLFYDDRTSDNLMEDVSAIEVEDMEPTEVAWF